MKTTEDKPQVQERWYITTDFFRNGGEFIAGLGPWDTREEALAARFGYELGTRREGRYFVDSWPVREMEQS